MTVLTPKNENKTNDIDGDIPQFGHFPASFPSYEIMDVALCGKKLRGERIPREANSELCVVCLDLARGIAERFMREE